MKTNSHKKKVVKCNVVKGCGKPATYDFLLATPDNKVKEMSGCDKCLIALQKSMNAVLLDGTK